MAVRDRYPRMLPRDPRQIQAHLHLRPASDDALRLAERNRLAVGPDEIAYDFRFHPHAGRNVSLSGKRIAITVERAQRARWAESPSPARISFREPSGAPPRAESATDRPWATALLRRPYRIAAKRFV